MAQTGLSRTSDMMNKLTVLQTRDNTDALAKLSTCVGSSITGLGETAAGMTLRFANGVRVVFALGDHVAVLNDLADVLSAFGNFTGGTLLSVDDRTFTIAGIGEITVRVP